MNDVKENEWKENLLYTASLVALSKELHPYIKGERMNMSSPAGALKKVPCTFYNLSDEGKLRKKANAYGLSQPTVSVFADPYAQ